MGWAWAPRSFFLGGGGGLGRRPVGWHMGNRAASSGRTPLLLLLPAAQLACWHLSSDYRPRMQDV